jgi:hypothetical protein
LITKRIIQDTDATRHGGTLPRVDLAIYA